MTAMTQPAVVWRATNSGADLQCGPLQGAVLCNALGFAFVTRRWESTDWNKGPRLLASRRLEQSSDDHFNVQDSYVRGSDFVVSFRPTAPHRVTCHAYWRASFDARFRAPRIELILSAQTDLLDSVPGWVIYGSVPGANILHSNDLNQHRFDELPNSPASFESPNGKEHLFVFRDTDVSYAQMVHPTDFVSARLQHTRHVETKLFPEHLEKGVIRRGRICGWFMPAENDLETAVELAREFVNEPPPLTA